MKFLVRARSIATMIEGKFHHMQGETVELDKDDPRVAHYTKQGAITPVQEAKHAAEETKPEEPKPEEPTPPPTPTKSTSSKTASADSK